MTVYNTEWQFSWDYKWLQGFLGGWWLVAEWVVEWWSGCGCRLSMANIDADGRFVENPPK